MKVFFIIGSILFLVEPLWGMDNLSRKIITHNRNISRDLEGEFVIEETVDGLLCKKLKLFYILSFYYPRENKMIQIKKKMIPIDKSDLHTFNIAVSDTYDVSNIIYLGMNREDINSLESTMGELLRLKKNQRVFLETFSWDSTEAICLRSDESPLYSIRGAVTQ